MIPEELRHVRRIGRGPWKTCQAERLCHHPQSALVLIDGGGFKAGFRFRADDDPGYLTAPIGVIRPGFVKHDHQDPVVLEERAGDQRIDVVAKPGIGGGERTIMGIIAKIG